MKQPIQESRPSILPHETTSFSTSDWRAIIVRREDGDLFVLPNVTGEQRIEGEGLVWLLPTPDSGLHSLLVRVRNGATVSVGDTGIEIGSGEHEIEEHETRPRTDVMGNAYSLSIEHGEELEEALAAFHWDTMIPCVVERTSGVDYPDRDGFVQSSPSTERFAGTYPSCDHEFGIKGRMAFGNDLDLAVIRRMIELALRTMRENPNGTWGCPCAVQPNGDREYYWMRGAMDGSVQARMFRLSGNAEVQEAAWLYYAATKDRDWLARNIENLENATTQIERFLDTDGRLDAAAFYEDAIIKDGFSAESSALTARALGLLAELENTLGRTDKAAYFSELSQRITGHLTRPFPDGLWDAKNQRFIDWIDRNGIPHDHMHLPANILPPLLGYANQEQKTAVETLVRAEFEAFQRFPTFVAARIADYNDSEIGIHGPFDSCAMARTWCWDAAYWHSRGESQVLLDQLLTVARKGESEGWRMAERYGLDQAQSVAGYGSPDYYEYPCVFAWVLMHEYLGVRPALDADLEIAPRIVGEGEVTLKAPQFAVAYRKTGNQLTITNLAPNTRTFRVNGALELLTLAPGETAKVKQ